METKTTLDLFSGAGGLSCGFDQAGFNTILAIDNDDRAIETIRRNIATAGLVEDLTEFHPEDAPIDKAQVDGVVGGPPCQDFSVANFFSRGGERTNLVFVFAKWVKQYNPDFFVMENVVGIKSTDNVFEELLDTFPDKYDVQHKTLNAQDFGVPQRRNRVIIVGTKGDFEFPSGGGSSTVSDAFDGLPYVEAGETDDSVFNHRAPNHQQSTIDRIANCDQGDPLFDSWTEKIRLVPDEVAPTLKAGKRANYHFGHPEIPRGLTIRERARLQGFPDDYEFMGGVTDQRTQTGNAVPPPMAKAVAAAIMEGLE